MEEPDQGKQAGLSEHTPLLNAGIDELSRSLMESIATKYFHSQKQTAHKDSRL